MKNKDVSINYLFKSHSIFVSFYNNICGLTGTIRTKFDKQIYQQQYKLITQKIPRNKMNLRVEYPIIICTDINERNRKITLETIEMNKKGQTVLVIFQDFNEIVDVFRKLSLNRIKNINIFDRRDEKIKPDYISGSNGAVSLGTNICGRGTDIKNLKKPLHVIISYYTSNARSMLQAFRRTARQGNEGSVRIICLESQYIAPINALNDDEMNGILSNLAIINKIQMDFVNEFKNSRSWIFSNVMKSQLISDDDIAYMRDTKINVNRIKVVNYEYPICMSIPTFLIIQAQKIFSLYNCPKCKYTWILFQKYIREMILETWSLFIEKTEKKYNETSINVKYEDYLLSEIKILYGWLEYYLPEEPDICPIVPTFMHIFRKVRERYEKQVLQSFPEELTDFMKNVGNKKFCSFTIGFKPYSLVDKSGAKIDSLNGNDQKQAYIKDPELIYRQKIDKHRYSFISITEKIDGIFNMICQKINDVIGGFLGLNFSLVEL